MISSGSSGQDRWVSLPLYCGWEAASTSAGTTLAIVVGCRARWSVRRFSAAYGIWSRMMNRENVTNRQHHLLKSIIKLPTHRPAPSPSGEQWPTVLPFHHIRRRTRIANPEVLELKKISKEVILHAPRSLTFESDINIHLFTLAMCLAM